MSYLLDTNIVSETRRPRPDPGVLDWFASVDGESLYLSVLALGEIKAGIERLRPRDGIQAAVIDRWLTRLRREYAQRLLPVTVEVAEEWGRMNAAGPLPTVDGLMAATARVHGLTLVTRNTADVGRTGVPLLNPFSSPSGT